MQAHERDRMQEMASREAETMGTHSSEKSLEDMKARDWRIFRRASATPLRKWDEAFDLLPAVSKAIHEMGFERPSPIQMQSIPIGLQKRDIIVNAETGSEKNRGVYDPDHCRYLLAANLDGRAVTEALHVTLKLQKDGKERVPSARGARGHGLCLGHSVVLYGKSLRARSLVWQGRRRCA
ncbi:hypothetical protein PsorP6_008408 [Peronosclerospora sorghi]|uniref:Uncharacterized protein n=1 Tax=Peronosclerospora sorghi TaxID=230839 RepID=A0ACC0WAW6_9STRA|nr:hypothetical protein PsorP6_008408 [Peronosclerospora sorghi]